MVVATGGTVKQRTALAAETASGGA